MTERMTTGRAIVEMLRVNGVDTLFGLPGAQTYPLFDALHDQRNAIRTVSARHEQACGYMALGYAQSTGRPGVYSVVPGPGVLNSTAALCTAYACNQPVVCLTGQVPSEFLGRGRGHLHELPDQLATLRSLIKWAERIDHPQQAPRLVDAAFRQARSGRSGPVALETCWDTLARDAAVELLGAAEPDPAPAPDPDAVTRAAKLLAVAKAPMIMVGGGAQHAGAEVLALAELLNAPITAFRGGRGAVPEDHELFVNSVAGYELWGGTDVMIGIGSRLEMPYMRWTGMGRLIDRPLAPPHLIRIDIDPREMTRLIPHAGIVADAAAGARALAAAVEAHHRPDPDKRARIAAARATAAQQVERVQPHIAYLKTIREVLPRDGFFVEEICQAGFASFFGFPVYAPRRYVTSGYQGNLGFGFPTALGVKVAHPDKAVVAIAGDGGFLFAAQELATAVKERIGVVTVLFNNGAYGNVRRDQQQRFDGRVIASELDNPDFVKLAESFGVAATRAEGPAALRPLLERAIADDVPALIEVPLDPDSEISPWEFIVRG